MKQWCVLIILIIGAVKSFCQGLETVPPVLADTPHVKINEKVSFILTADLRHYPKGIRPYVNCVEIVDADQPWPPRWYFPGKKYNPPASENDTAKILEELFLDARYQNGFITFSSGLIADYKPLVRFAQTTQYIICNEKLEAVDSLKNTGTPINAQDFRINEKKKNYLCSIRIPCLTCGMLQAMKRTQQHYQQLILSRYWIQQIRYASNGTLLRNLVSVQYIFLTVC